MKRNNDFINYVKQDHPPCCSNLCPWYGIGQQRTSQTMASLVGSWECPPGPSNTGASALLPQFVPAVQDQTTKDVSNAGVVGWLMGASARSLQQGSVCPVAPISSCGARLDNKGRLECRHHRLDCRSVRLVPPTQECPPFCSNLCPWHRTR